jgi:hypothetical protein
VAALAGPGARGFLVAAENANAWRKPPMKLFIFLSADTS